MEKSVKKNFVYNSVFQIILLLIPLITTPYVSRILGPDNIGKYSFAIAVVTYFVVICTLGSTIFGQRNIAYYRDDKSELSESFWDVFSFRLISGIMFSILYFVYLLYTDSVNSLTIIVGLNIVNVIVDITWFYQGIEEFKKTIARSVIIKLFSLFAIFVFIRTKNDTALYALIFCGSIVVGNIVLWIPLRKFILRPYKFSPFKNIPGMFLVFLPTIASQVYTILDKSMIGWITKSDYDNGCYEQSERLARAALTVITAVGAVILPRVANLYKKGELESARNYVYKGYRVVWALGFPLMFGTIAIAPVLIPIYLGDNFELSIVLLQIFSLLIVFVSLAYVTGISYLLPTGQQNVYTLSVVIAAVVNFSMNIRMISYYGAIGAAIASISAEFIGVIIQIGFCIKKRQLSFAGIFASAIKYLISATIMFVVIFFVERMLSVSIINLLILFILGILVYAVMLFVLRDSMFISVLCSLRNRLAKK